MKSNAQGSRLTTRGTQLCWSRSKSSWTLRGERRKRFLKNSELAAPKFGRCPGDLGQSIEERTIERNYGIELKSQY